MLPGNYLFCRCLFWGWPEKVLMIYYCSSDVILKQCNSNFQVQAVTVHATNNYFVTASLDSTWCFYDITSGLCLTQVIILSSLLFIYIFRLKCWNLRRISLRSYRDTPNIISHHLYTFLYLSLMQEISFCSLGWGYFSVSGLHICGLSSWWSHPWSRYLRGCCQDLGCQKSGV